MTFEQQWEKAAPLMMHFAKKLKRGRMDDAKDLFQETAYRCCRAYHQFDQRSNFGTWASRVMLNITRDDYKKLHRRPLTTELEEKHETVCGGILGGQEKIDDDAYLESKLQTLQELVTPDNWAVFLLDLENLSYAEIAEQLGINIGTVRSRLNRARTVLRKHIKAA
jgi:RNA polymerase sigma-70 factor (ECF subfamily)